MPNTSSDSAAQKSRREEDGQEERTADHRADRTAHRTEDREEKQPSPGPMVLLRRAREQLAELTGMAAETVSSFEQSENGWTLEVEVLELARIPDTMSLMGSYEVRLDQQGQLTGYRRVRRYERGRSDPHRSGGR